MATNVPSRDPRLNRGKPHQRDDPRKRLASQPPAGDTRSPKRHAEGSSSLDGSLPRPLDRPSTGTHSRDSSTSVNSKGSGDAASHTRTDPHRMSNAGVTNERHHNASNSLPSEAAAQGTSGLKMQTQADSLAVRGALSGNASHEDLDGVQSGSSARGNNKQLLVAMFSGTTDLAMAKTAYFQAEAALKKAVKEYNGTYSHFKEFPAIREQKTSEKAKAEERFKAATDKLQYLEKQLERQVNELVPILGTGSPRRPPPVQSTDNFLDDKVEQLRHEIENIRTDLVQLTIDMEDRSRLKQGVDELQERIIPLERSVNEKQSQASPKEAGRINALEQAIKDLRSEQDDQMQVIDQHVEDKLTQTNGPIKDRVDNGLGELRAVFEEGKRVQHQNAQEINNCSARLDALDQELKERMSTLDDLMRQVEKIADDVKKLGTTETEAPAQTKGNPLALPQFRPVYDEPANEDLPRINHLQSQVQALQAACADHKARLDNMTTDHIVQQMSHQMSNMYPHLKEYNQITTRLTQSVSDIQGGLNAVFTRIDKLEQASTAEDIASLRVDLVAVQQKVQDVETLGEQELGKMHAKLKDLEKETALARGGSDSNYEQIKKILDAQR